MLGAAVTAVAITSIAGSLHAETPPKAPVAAADTQIEDPAAGARPARRLTPAPRRAVIISDSAMAGVRWNLALGGFRGFEADDRLESCRRLVATSCLGREGRRPPTALVEIQDLAVPAPTDVFVIATGYNDWHANFAAHARLVLDAARAKGFDTIAWVTYRENVTYQLPSSSEVAVSSYAVMNDELDKLVGSGDYPELVLWDLHRYTLNTQGWFYEDGVHERPLGSWGVADWISRHMAALDGRPCAMP